MSKDTRSSLTLGANQHGTAVCTVTARNAGGTRSALSKPIAIG